MTVNELQPSPFHFAARSHLTTTWWYGWGGYAVPDVYDSPWAEVAAIRTGVAMGDMSPIPKLRITGKDAHACANYFVTRDLAGLPQGRSCYTPWCSEEGMVVSDGIVFHHLDGSIIFTGDSSLGFFRARAGSFEVSIEDVTGEFGILALQGPRSREVLELATGESWSTFKFCEMRRTMIGGVKVSVTRQGFTGELGYELWVAREDGATVWESVASAGQPMGIRAAGEYAIDIARVEAGLILVSADYTGAGTDGHSADVVVDSGGTATPFELGIGHCVDLSKEKDFVGKRALLDAHQRGPSCRLMGIEIDHEAVISLYRNSGLPANVSPRVRWDRLALSHNGNRVGFASSITWSPTLGKLIGFSRADTTVARPGTRLDLHWKDFWGEDLRKVPATLVEIPFIKLRRSS